ncbi:molecular chaperone TorD family protein [Halomonas sp. ML-15]|uniref:TorD/DmsD family molecular chaperone n=1 Tax=Halomonas sp. ML-15 TaxID=2773305 RepID=UPI0017468034|nr:molecular chaperone TorD family protein [Halomonas sp. ML-15]MBD3895900.1 molecular chaperone TorD family protein [Halomonas sp. ML-15]
MTDQSTCPDLLPAAELYLCLARALLAPRAGVTLDELKGPLLEDLHSLADGLPALQVERLDKLAQALDDLLNDERLILGYSRLFLTPPAPAPLNLGAYLDGALMGQSTQSMLALYRRHGLERDPAFHDLPDHLSLNLQWLAWVYSEAMEARDAGEETTPLISDAVTMLRDITLPALAALRGKLAQTNPEDTLTRPWRQLIDLAYDQLKYDLSRLKSVLPAPTPRASQEPSRASARDAITTFEASEAPRETLTCRACGEAFESDPVLAEMRQRLATAGVSAEHMTVCPRCQGRSAASTSLRPPGAGLKAWQ